MARLWKRWDTRLSLVIVALYAVAAIYGEGAYQVARMQDRTPAYNEVNEAHRYVPPAFVRCFQGGSSVSPAADKGNVNRPFYLLGSDNLGRDVAQRLIQGTRIAFHVGIVTSLIAIPLGVLLGCLGGYFGGRMDSLVVWLSATVASMPGLLFILAVAMVAGKGLMGIYLGIGLTTWVSVCRNVRAEVIKHRGRTYVLAAEVLGYSPSRIMFRHILPNVSHIILIAFSIRFPASVATEVFISFLGIGVQSEPSWGIMINNARLRLWQGVWWEMTFVTCSIFFLVLAFNQLADALRDMLDPALRNE
jgi:peptide/nickel transport system permease protein